MSGRGNAAAANRAQLRNGVVRTIKKKRFNCYVVAIGKNPGIYKQW
jgi:hypothetical protein